VQLATPTPCSTGSWTQKWQCGLHEPVSPAVSHAGYTVGHTGAPVVLGLIVLVLIWIAATRRKSPATS
jgi:hypothetical protein